MMMMTISERPYTLSEKTTQRKHAPTLQPFLANNNKNSDKKLLAKDL